MPATVRANGCSGNQLSGFQRKRALRPSASAVRSEKLKAAAEQFQAFIKAYPYDPLVPLARVFLGRIALLENRVTAARTSLEDPAERAEKDAVGLQARFYLGLAEVRSGSAAKGQQLLTPFLATIDKQERPGLLAALAQAARQLKEYSKAVVLLSELYSLSPRATERLYARSSLEGILGGPISKEELQQCFRSVPPGSIAAALAGKKLAALERAAGNTEAAERYLNQTEGARNAHGVQIQASVVQPKGVVGLLIPLSGRYRAAGQLLLSGAIEASRNLGSMKESIPIAIGDSGQDALSAARTLILRERVVALMGTLDPANTARVAQLAATHGVPFLAFARNTSNPAVHPFVLLPDNTKRATTLARHCIQRLRIKRFAILRPDSNYGKQMASTFAREVQAKGGRIVVELTYPRTSSTFSSQTKTLRRYRFHGLFVPDSAPRLALVAPALAQEGLWSSPNQPHTRGSRKVKLLATADGLTARIITIAGRYLQDALLAPGYFPDPSAPGSGPLASRYHNSEGHWPGLLEALGFDAVELIRAHLQQGSKEHATMNKALTGPVAIQGLTGKIRFDVQGQRLDRALLYTIKEGRIVQLEN